MRSLFIFIILSAVSISIAWWLFFPLAAIAIFYHKQIYASMLAGLVLDIMYFDQKFPILLCASFFIVLLFAILEDKLRYNA